MTLSNTYMTEVINLGDAHQSRSKLPFLGLPSNGGISIQQQYNTLKYLNHV